MNEQIEWTGKQFKFSCGIGGRIGDKRNAIKLSSIDQLTPKEFLRAVRTIEKRLEAVNV